MTFREGERMSLMQVDLEDKYRLDAGRIYLSGIQALVRLPLLQRQRDRAHNLKTAGFIAGYRGSPLGMYDHALWRAKSHLQANDIAFVPGLNEDLAATAVWGSQQSAFIRAPRSMVSSASGTARARASTARWTRSSTPIRRARRATAASLPSPATIAAASRRRWRIRASRCSPRR
jgi:hypothetical protein